MKKIKVGLIGFGLSGKHFHLPLLQGHGGHEVVMICSSKEDDVKRSLPSARITNDPYALITDANVELVINCAPNTHHYTYAEATLITGKHVVVEKPFVNTLQEGLDLIELSKKYGGSLSVFHNRRWDNDYLTVKKILAEGKLGVIKHFESHFDRWKPQVRVDRWKERAMPGSGLLYDLGSHLIDQALDLFGMPEAISADICQQKNGSLVDDFFHIILRYKEMRVILQSSSFNPNTPRFQIFGDQGSFIKHGLDPQEEQMKAGISINDSHFGVENEKLSGVMTLPFEEKTLSLTSEKGAYVNFYDILYKRIIGGMGDVPVSANEALNVIRLIELAQESSKTGRVVKVLSPE